MQVENCVGDVGRLDFHDVDPELLDRNDRPRCLLTEQRGEAQQVLLITELVPRLVLFEQPLDFGGLPGNRRQSRNEELCPPSISVFQYVENLLYENGLRLEGRRIT